MTKRRVEINDETGDVYLPGYYGNRPIGHVEDFLHQLLQALAILRCGNPHGSIEVGARTATQSNTGDSCVHSPERMEVPLA